MDLKNKVFIVTGAGSGLGKVLVEKLKNLGAISLGTIHNSGEGIRCDITLEDDVESLFNSVKDAYHKIDGVINCACLCMDNSYEDKTGEEFLKVLNVDLVGTFLIDKYASLNMDDGVVINISSLDGIDTYGALSMDYSAAKAGVNNLTMNFAKTNPKVKYLALCPAWIDTEAVLEMDKHFLEAELKKNGQDKLLKKEDVADKIIDMLINDKYKSGEIVRMDR